MRFFLKTVYRVLKTKKKGKIAQLIKRKNRLIVEKFIRKNIPVVLADRTIPELNVDYVTTDNFQGAYQITKYLIDKGHTRISFLFCAFLIKTCMESYRISTA